MTSLLSRVSSDHCRCQDFHFVVFSSFPEPRWASVNRGVLICDECCSVHRSLGRHSSQVRHLMHTPWPPTQLQVITPNPPQRLRGPPNQRLNVCCEKTHIGLYLIIYFTSGSSITSSSFGVSDISLHNYQWQKTQSIPAHFEL